MANGLKIKKGDTAVVISGKEKGKKGKVLKVMPSDGKAVIEAVNMLTMHKKPKNQRTPGGIIKQEGALPLSNLMVVCPNCSKATRVGHKLEEVDGKMQKTRVCKKCGKEL